MDVITNNKNNCNLALQGLHNVYDPEIGLNVVDLGLIYEINFDEEKKKVQTIMTLTSQFCPMGESITSDVTRTLEGIFKGFDVKVELTFDPSWTADFVSPEGLKFLNS